MSTDAADAAEIEESAPSNAELAARIDRQESKLDMLIEAVKGTENKAHAAAQQHTEERLDRPTDIGEQIRVQLEQQRAADAADAEKKGNADRLAAVENRLAGMSEQTPEAPLRRVERIMGWR